MDSLYFVSMIVGIGWLAVWSALPAGLPFASPFDMAEAPAGPPSASDGPPPARAAKVPVPEASGRAAIPEARGATGWRQRVRPSRSEAAEARQPAPERRPVSSWRLRRDAAPPSRKGR